MLGLLLIIGAVGGVYLYSQNASATTQNLEVSVGQKFLNPNYDLFDVSPDDQQGGFLKTYDQQMLEASVITGVPFALIKAHSIQESSLKPSAFRQEKKGASYGLMQVMWWPSSQRFQKWGYSDDQLAQGQKLFDPTINCFLGAMVIKDNLERFDSLDDAINAYNTGVSVSQHSAPYDYVKKVKNYYQKILGGSIT